MTGYGKAEAILETGKLTVEIRTLNGKSADISIKSSLLPKDKEILVRQKVADMLNRGTIDFFLSWEPNAASEAKTINEDLVVEYFRQVDKIRKDLSCASSDMADNVLLTSILRFPDVIDAGAKKQEIINEDNWNVVEAAIDSAIDAVNDYRSREGVALYKDVTGRVRNILDLENRVESFEAERIETR